MYAVIRAGGKQYKVAPGDVIRVEKWTGTGGRCSSTTCWRFPPRRAASCKPDREALVTGEVLEQGRGAKILVFHYKKKKQYKKLRGHRQDYSAVRITEIAFDGQSFKAPELPKKEKKVKKAPSRRRGSRSGASKQNRQRRSSRQEGSGEEDHYERRSRGERESFASRMKGFNRE